MRIAHAARQRNVAQLFPGSSKHAQAVPIALRMRTPFAKTALKLIASSHPERRSFR